jgi:Ca2+-binding EF-hand superfamily protein
MFRATFAAACALSVALVGCSGHKGPPPPTFSPNGEPLVPPLWPAKCEDALDAWFDRLDSSHAGRLTLAQLEADARRQYQEMDLRHDGKVTAEELSKYRLAQMHGHFLSVSTPGQGGILGSRNDDEDRPGDRLDDAMGDDNPRHGRRKDDEDRPRDAYAALVTDQPDPVMTADADLDGSVTWEEFRALVAQNFADFDKEHVGFITKDELRVTCADR